MNSAADLVMIARVAGSLIVVLVLVAVAARVARRGRWHRSVGGVRVVHRTGLTRDASVAVVEVAGRALVLGVTAHGVSVLTVLDSQELDPDRADDRADDDRAAGLPNGLPGGLPGDLPADLDRLLVDVSDPRDGTGAERRRRARRAGDPSPSAAPGVPRTGRGAEGVADGFPLAGGERLSTEDFGRIIEEAGQRLFGATERSGERPGGRDPGLLPEGVRVDQYPDLASALRAAGRVQGPAGKPSAATAPRPAAARPATPDPVAKPPARPAAKAAPAKPRQASGSVLDPATWKQGLEALRDLTARKG